MTDIHEQVVFGRTGLRVSPLCIGSGSWGAPRAGEDETARDERLSAVTRDWFAGKLPTNYLDTSNIYGESQSEVVIGRALREAGGLAEGLVLQTKLDRRLSDDTFGTDQMELSLEQSLDRLGVDHLQVLYLHDPEHIGFRAAMAPGGPVEALVSMKERGLVDSIGISGGPVGMLQEFVETDAFDALITHNRYTLVDRSADALLDAATAHRVGVDNGAPWGAGVLTGDPKFRDTYGYQPIRPEVRAAVDGIEALCREAGISLAAAALQFSLREPRVHSTIVGISSRGRYDGVLADAEIEIPEGFWDDVDALLPPPSAALDAPR